MESTWVFHRGSLGDSILLWPMLRALAAGDRVALVADGEKAHLAARELGVEPHDAEQRRFNALWIDGAAPEPLEAATRVLWVGGDASSPAGRAWCANAASMFPRAAIEIIPGRVDRPAALALAARFSPTPPHPPHAPRRAAPAGAPIVVHVGAGAPSKRWPMPQWRSLADAVGPVVALAGEVEAERFTEHDRREFGALGGRYVESLQALADAIRPARLYIGADTGPTHLAAALGVPTIALFGPTDPDRWGPIGPDVRVIRAPDGSMPGLDP